MQLGIIFFPYRIEHIHHMIDCKARVRQCLVPGCHHYGTQDTMEEHSALAYHQHHMLLRLQFENLASLISNKVIGLHFITMVH